MYQIAHENNVSYINDIHENLNEMVHDLEANDGDIDQEDLQQLFEDAEKPLESQGALLPQIPTSWPQMVEQPMSSHPSTTEPAEPKQIQEDRIKERLDRVKF
ncbi:hypothetical protein Tco_1546631 [Tanacetum coccineum]